MNGLNGPVSPAVQLRIKLKRARAYGQDFDTAWEAAFENIRWPHDTTHRREWKAILGDPLAKEVWRAAFHHEEIDYRERAVARLIAA